MDVIPVLLLGKNLLRLPQFPRVKGPVPKQSLRLFFPKQTNLTTPVEVMDVEGVLVILTGFRHLRSCGDIAE